MAASPIMPTAAGNFAPQDLETPNGPMEKIQTVSDLSKFVFKYVLYKTSNSSLTEHVLELYPGVKIGRIIEVEGSYVLHKVISQKISAATAFLLKDGMLKDFYIRLPNQQEQVQISALQRE